MPGKVDLWDAGLAKRQHSAGTCIVGWKPGEKGKVERSTWSHHRVDGQSTDDAERLERRERKMS